MMMRMKELKQSSLLQVRRVWQSLWIENHQVMISIKN